MVVQILLILSQILVSIVKNIAYILAIRAKISSEWIRMFLKTLNHATFCSDISSQFETYSVNSNSLIHIGSSQNTIYVLVVSWGSVGDHAGGLSKGLHWIYAWADILLACFCNISSFRFALLVNLFEVAVDILVVIVRFRWDVTWLLWGTFRRARADLTSSYELL